MPVLTEADKKWLEERKPPTKQPYKTTADDNFCRYCARYNTHCTPWFRDVAYCPTDQGGDFRDAAEFEARVAAKLAQSPCWSCPEKSKLSCPRGKSDANGRPKAEACRLKHVRLAVEQEMDV